MYRRRLERPCESYTPGFTIPKMACLLQGGVRVQAERNQAANPPNPLANRMLSGTSDQFFTGLQQANIPAPIRIRRWDWLLEIKWKRVPLNHDLADHPKV